MRKKDESNSLNAGFAKHTILILMTLQLNVFSRVISKGTSFIEQSEKGYFPSSLRILANLANYSVLQ